MPHSEHRPQVVEEVTRLHDVQETAVRPNSLRYEEIVLENVDKRTSTVLRHGSPSIVGH